MGSKQHHFVFVHGACHGVWCWERITSILEKAGHRVTAVDLASAGDSPVKAEDVTSFKQYNQPIIDVFESFPDSEKVILVGHSMGGFTITYLSETFPKKISVAVYLSAIMLAPGLDINELNSMYPELQVFPAFEYEFKVDGGPPTSLKLSASTLKEDFYNKSSPEDLAIALNRVMPCPLPGPICAPIHCTMENYGSVPRVCIIALQDRAIFPAFSRKLIELNPPDEVIEVDGDHSLFFSDLKTLEKLLNDAAAKYDSLSSRNMNGHIKEGEKISMKL